MEAAEAIQAIGVDKLGTIAVLLVVQLAITMFFCFKMYNDKNK